MSAPAPAPVPAPVDTLAPREAYRLWAPAYEAETAVSFMDELLVRRLTPRLHGRVLLDAGCGTGRRARARTEAARVLGADVTPEMLALAARPAGSALWVAADVRALPLRPALADVVWCRLVLGHLPALEQAYAELARVCRPGGAVLVTDFHPRAVRAGHTRTFRDGDGRLHGVEHRLHDLSHHLAAARLAGLHMVRRLDGRVGPEIRDFYRRADRMAAYQQATGLPIVLALLFPARLIRVRLRIEGAGFSVGVEGGRMVEPEGRFDVTLRVADGEIRPGLINAHEHLHRNHYPALGAPPYANSYEWGRDIHERHAAEIARGRAVARRQALLVGAWRNLLAGVTTVVHHDAWEPSFARRFPIRVARVRTAHSLRLEPKLGSDSGRALSIHLAEGVDEAAAEEVRELERLGLLNQRLIAVHVLGADEDGVRRLRAAGAAIAWCPSSNIYLFGRTVPPALLQPGMDVLLGSDSLLTGAGSLLEELRLARGLGLLDDDRLADAVGATAARRLGLPAPSLEPGAVADLVVLRQPLLQATLADVALVLVGGEVRVADRALGGALDRLGLAPALVGEGSLARRVACAGEGELLAARAGWRAALAMRPAIEPRARPRAQAQRPLPGSSARSRTQARRR